VVDEVGVILAAKLEEHIVDGKVGGLVVGQAGTAQLAEVVGRLVLIAKGRVIKDGRVGAAVGGGGKDGVDVDDLVVIRAPATTRHRAAHDAVTVLRYGGERVI